MPENERMNVGCEDGIENNANLLKKYQTKDNKIRINKIIITFRFVYWRAILFRQLDMPAEELVELIRQDFWKNRSTAGRQQIVNDIWKEELGKFRLQTRANETNSEQWRGSVICEQR